MSTSPGARVGTDKLHYTCIDVANDNTTMGKSTREQPDKDICPRIIDKDQTSVANNRDKHRFPSTNRIWILVYIL